MIKKLTELGWTLMHSQYGCKEYAKQGYYNKSICIDPSGDVTAYNDSKSCDDCYEAETLTKNEILAIAEEIKNL